MQESPDLRGPHLPNLLGGGLEGEGLVLAVEGDLELESVFVYRVPQVHQRHLDRESRKKDSSYK